MRCIVVYPKYPFLYKGTVILQPTNSRVDCRFLEVLIDASKSFSK